MKFREYLESNKETAQIIYGAVLIILIPLLIVFNTVFIIKKYNQSLDLALQGQALAVPDGHVVLLQQVLEGPGGTVGPQTNAFSAGTRSEVPASGGHARDRDALSCCLAEAHFPPTLSQ